MEYKIKEEKLTELIGDFREFEKRFNERISDLYEVKGGMQARHAYVYYRRLLWDIRDKLEKSLVEVKVKKSK